MNSTLFEIEDDLYALEDILSECSDDVDEDAFAALYSWQHEIEGSLSDKMQRIAHVISTIEARAGARKAKAAELATLAKYDEGKAERLKAYALDTMRRAGIKRIDTDTGAVTRAANGGKLPLVVDDDGIPEVIPEEVRKVTISLDKAALRERIDAGAEYSFARIGERGEHLRIK